MNERSARAIALARALEQNDRAQRLLGAEDRLQASRGARELSHWQAARQNSAVTSELYLYQRAQLLLDRLQPRHPMLAAVRRTAQWPLWAGLGSALLALLVGGLAERIANPHRVDLLSPALLAIVGWNLLVYLGLLLWPLLAPRWRGAAAASGVETGLAHWLARARARWKPRAPPAAGHPHDDSGSELGAALLAFRRDWTRLSAPLNAARIARMLHLAAALFAAGAIASLYLRGIVSEYRVGWESTFLDAGEVHALLSIVFWPVVELLRLAPFSVAQVAALQFGQPPQPASGAQWVHLYAALLALLVVLPRLVLAALAWRAERRLAHAFRLDPGEPYFRRLLASAGSTGSRPADAAAAALCVLPYSFGVNEARAAGLRAGAAQLLGDDARLRLLPSLDYGAEPAAALHTAAAAEPAALTLVLFNLAATPEAENHGAVLDRLSATGARRAAVLVDESGLAERLGVQPGAAVRLAERRALWRRFGEAHGLSVAFVDLLRPALDGIEHDLGPRVSTAAAAA